MLTNSNKKLILSETVGDFFIRLGGLSIPNNIQILADESLWWIASGKNVDDICTSCFELRYRTWRQAQVLARTNRYANALTSSLDTINVSDKDIVKLRSCIEKSDNNNQYDSWFCFDSHTGELIEQAMILPEDSCKRCEKKWDVINNFLPTTIDDIEAFLTQWFGLVATINVFEQQSQRDSSFIALVLSVMRRFGEYAPILCAGQAQTMQHAKLKSIMEYVERYAQTNQCKESDIYRLSDGDQKNIEYEVCSDEPWRDLWDQHLMQKMPEQQTVYYYGENIIRGTPALIPAHLIDHSYQKVRWFEGDLAPLAPTTNGFAAHVDMQQSREHGVLELIERDACMRWWCSPEKAIRIQPNDAQQRLMLFLQAQIEKISRSSIDILLFKLDTRVGVPVSLVIATSQNKDHGPALLVGSAASFEWSCAVDKALSELRMSVYNYQMYMQSLQDRLLPEAYDFSSVRRPSDHAELYYSEHFRSELSFISVLQELDITVYMAQGGPKDYQHLLKLLHEQNIPVYALEKTPRFGKKSGVVVSRVVMPSLYPLQFGFGPVMRDSTCSDLSHARRLPHCFF